MAKKKEHEFVPSVFDRLVEPTTGDVFKTRSQQLRELKQSVRRDLENLLNTRWRCRTWPPGLDELEVSLANYGIPDFTGADINMYDGKEQLREIIERVITVFEPRFKTVRVSLIQNEDDMDRTLRLRIDAMLHAEPAPEAVTFESQLDPLTSEITVERDAR